MTTKIKLTPALEAAIERSITRRHGRTISEIGADLLNRSTVVPEKRKELDQTQAKRFLAGEYQRVPGPHGQMIEKPPDPELERSFERKEVHLRLELTEERHSLITEFAKLAFKYLENKYGKPRFENGVVVGMGSGIIVHPDQHIELVTGVDISALAGEGVAS